MEGPEDTSGDSDTVRSGTFGRCLFGVPFCVGDLHGDPTSVGTCDLRGEKLLSEESEKSREYLDRWEDWSEALSRLL